MAVYIGFHDKISRVQANCAESGTTWLNIDFSDESGVLAGSTTIFAHSEDKFDYLRSLGQQIIEAANLAESNSVNEVQ